MEAWIDPEGCRRFIVEKKSAFEHQVDLEMEVQKSKESLNHFDFRAVTWRPGERRVAGDDRRIKRFRQGYVHRGVRRDVVAQLPRTHQKIEMGVTVEIEAGEIRERVGRAVR